MSLIWYSKIYVWTWGKYWKKHPHFVQKQKKRKNRKTEIRTLVRGGHGIHGTHANAPSAWDNEIILLKKIVKQAIDKKEIPILKKKSLSTKTFIPYTKKSKNRKK